MYSLAELRKHQYEYHSKVYPFVDNRRRNPYTWLKSRFYMEVSALLVYFLLKTKIKANTVSITYALLGLVAGILLAVPTKVTILTAISIFFLKAILDWSDGHLARLKNQVSITGGVLDPYGSLVGTLAFQTGLGFYVGFKSGIVIFYYLAALIPLSYALELPQYAFYQLYIEHLAPKNISKYIKKNASSSTVKSRNKMQTKDLKNKYGKVFSFIRNFLDERSRTVDFVCLLILLEVFTPIFVTWIIFLGFTIKRLLVFSASFYLITRGGWVEEKFGEKVEELSRAFKSDN